MIRFSRELLYQGTELKSTDVFEGESACHLETATALCDSAVITLSGSYRIVGHMCGFFSTRHIKLKRMCKNVYGEKIKKKGCITGKKGLKIIVITSLQRPR
jgi:hypothetical protein